MRRFISGGVALLLLLSLSALIASTTADARPAPADPAAHERTAGRPVYYNGWGTLRLGMNRAKAWRTGMVSHRYSACDAGYDMNPAYRERGFLVWNGADRPGRLKVTRIVVFGTQDHTVAGAGVGTTLRQLRRLYPDLSPVTGASALDDQPGRDKRDLWIASARKPWGVLNFQFPYAAKPRATSKVDRIVVSRKQEVYWGC